MKRAILLLTIGTLSAWTATAQSVASGQAVGSAATSSSTSATANGGNASVNISSDTKIDATLATSLDAKWSRAGDDVEVRTEEDVKEDGKVVLKKGTHLVGHVTRAQVRAGGQTQSQLGIVFDHAVLNDGQEVPFSAAIQAVASAQPRAASGDDKMAPGAAATAAVQRSGRSASLVGGVASNAGATVGATSAAVMNTSSSFPLNSGGTLNTVARSSGAVGGLTTAGRLASNSSGVFGLEGLSIDSAASTATQESIIVSATKNVHLDSGTQLLLRTTVPAQ